MSRSRSAWSLCSLCSLLLAGCGLSEYGTHSLSTAPLVVPGLNSKEDGYRPRVQTGDTYHGKTPYRYKPDVVWTCVARVPCRIWRVFGAPNYEFKQVTAYGDEVEDSSESRCRSRAADSAASYCDAIRKRYQWPFGAVNGPPVVKVESRAVD